MRSSIVLVCFVAWAVAAGADNLLANADFALDPTNPANGWSHVGSGSLSAANVGRPDPPSVRLAATGAQDVALFQCVSIVGYPLLDFWAYSYTEASIGASYSEVSIALYSSTDCSSGFLETAGTDQDSFPDWWFRRRLGYAPPPSAQSANFTLYASASGSTETIVFDSVHLPEPSAVASGVAAWVPLLELARRQRARHSARPQ